MSMALPYPTTFETPVREDLAAPSRQLNIAPLWETIPTLPLFGLFSLSVGRKKVSSLCEGL